MFERDYFLKDILLDETLSDKEQIQQMKAAFCLQSVEVESKPYIFVSYAHKDAAVVLPAIKAFQDRGYAVWYDEGIAAGVDWKKHIAEQIRGAALMVAFMSENAIASDNCITEIDHAVNHRLPILTVRLDQSEIPDGLDMYLERRQMFLAYLCKGDTYLSELVSCLDNLVKEGIVKNWDDGVAKSRKQSNKEKQGHGLDELWSRLVKMEAEMEEQEKLLGIPLKEEEAKKLLAEMFKHVQENLLEDGAYGYELAMTYVQRQMNTLVRFNPSLREDMKYYEDRIRGMIYQEARILERSEKYREALERYDALGKYRDSRKRFDALYVSQGRRYIFLLAIIVIAYCVVHCLQIKHFDGKSFSIMIYTLPMVVVVVSKYFVRYFCLGSLESESITKLSKIATVLTVVISVIVDIFSFLEMSIGERILKSIWYNAVGAVSALILLMFFVIWYSDTIDKHAII